MAAAAGLSASWLVGCEIMGRNVAQPLVPPGPPAVPGCYYRSPPLSEPFGGGRVQGHQAGVDVVEVNEHCRADAGPPGGRPRQRLAEPHPGCDFPLLWL